MFRSPILSRRVRLLGRSRRPLRAAGRWGCAPPHSEVPCLTLARTEPLESRVLLSADIVVGMTHFRRMARLTRAVSSRSRHSSTT